MANIPLLSFPRPDPSLSHAAASFQQNMCFRRFFIVSFVSRSPPHVPFVFLACYLSPSDSLYLNFDDSSTPFLSSVTFPILVHSYLSFVPVRMSPRTSPRSLSRCLDRLTSVRRRYLLPRTVVPFRRSHSLIRSPARSSTQTFHVHFRPSLISSLYKTRFRPPVAVKRSGPLFSSP